VGRQLTGDAGPVRRVSFSVTRALRRFTLAFVALLGAASCAPFGIVEALRVGAFVGDYRLVALDSTGTTAFTGTVTLTPESDSSLTASGNLSNFGSVHGEGFVHGDTLYVYLMPQASVAVGFDGTLTSSVFAGIWTYGMDACWVGACRHGPFTARRY